MTERQRVGAAFALLTLVWGTTWAAIRIALEGIPPLFGVAIRFSLAGLILLGWALARGVRIRGSAREWRLWIANALLTFAAAYGLIYWAEQRIPSGLASIIFATFPLWVVLFGRLLLTREPVGFRRAAGVLAGFLGVALLFSEDLELVVGPGAGTTALVLLASPALASVGSLVVKRWGQGMAPESMAAIPMLLCGAIMTPVALWFERDRAFSSLLAPWLATAYLALVGSALTFPVYFWLLARRSAVVASLVAYTAPVLAVAVGVVLFDEPVTPRILAGGLLVLAGVAAALAPGRRPA